MKKTLKSQLFAAASLCLVAAVALTGATYAWFTAMANPQVGNLNLYVKASDALFLSAYQDTDKPAIDLKADWKTSIAQTDISGTPVGKWGMQVNAFPDNMYNVSSLFDTDSNSFFKATAFDVSDNHPTAFAASTFTTKANNDYAKFNLWVKSTNNGYLYLDSGSSVAFDATKTLTDSQKKIADTVRVGFVPVESDGTTEHWADAVIWEPNSKDHLPSTNGGPVGDPTTKLPTSALKDAIGTSSAQTTFDFQTGDTNIKNTVDVPGYNSQIALFDLSADTVQQFHVYIWVEGADGDTVNAVAKSYFNTLLKFGQNFNVTKTTATTTKP